MIKITEKNRSLVFLAATMIIGVLIVGVLILVENNDVQGVEIIDEQANTNFKDLENKIDILKNQNFDPNSYNTLATAIDASYEQGLINSSAKANLISNLTTVYSNLVYNRCEFYLTGNTMNTSTDVLNWLSQLESITSRNSSIDYYRGQINAYIYYSETLPNKVDSFISPGITNYNDTLYYSFKNEIDNMPKLQPKYRAKPLFNNIKTRLINELAQFNTDWATAGVPTE
ncbi:hypothetical protein [Flavobacterium sp.]|uniref:hypothetical protein n=1 Tax=Flavobacterium sp. TaxID=239 RepID=UPI00248811CA|nr:hypothetical protein [Flavobacterium sp.]MDI1317429.1 hypothetical protein [Flavobacterium sp.]